MTLEKSCFRPKPDAERSSSICLRSYSSPLCCRWLPVINSCAPTGITPNEFLMNSFRVNAVCNSAGHSLQFSLIRSLVIGNHYCSKPMSRSKVIIQSRQLNCRECQPFREGRDVAVPTFSLECAEGDRLCRSWAEARVPSLTSYPVMSELCGLQPTWWDFKDPSKGGHAPRWSTPLAYSLGLNFHHREVFLCIGDTVAG